MLVEIHTNTISATKKIRKLTNTNDKKFKCTEMVENCIGEKQNINSLEIESQFTKMMALKNGEDGEF